MNTMPGFGKSTGNTSAGQEMRSIRSTWIANVTEKTNKNGTRYLLVKTEKGVSFMAWHPPTIDAILDRANRDEFTLVVKVREGFRHLYLPFNKAA